MPTRMTPIEVTALFPELRRQLLALLGALSEEQWQRPTICAGWSVKDVALHLLGVNIANLSRRRDGLADSLTAYAPPGADLSQHGTLVSVLNAWNDDWVMAARRMSPRVLCTLLAVTGDELAAFFGTLDGMAMGGAVGWAGPEPAPVWLDIAREYTEQWMHQAQIRDALGIGGIRERMLFAPVLAAFMYALPLALRTVDAAEGARWRVIITGEAGDTWDAVRSGDHWGLEAPSAAGVTATATLAAEDAWRLWTKGLPPEAAARAVQVTGDVRLGEAVRRMVAFIG